MSGSVVRIHNFSTTDPLLPFLTMGDFFRWNMPKKLLILEKLFWALNAKMESFWQQKK